METNLQTNLGVSARNIAAALNAGTTSGTSTAYTATLPGISSLVDGRIIEVVTHVTNGAGPSLNGIPIKSAAGIALPASTLPAGVPIQMVYSSAMVSWIFTGSPGLRQIVPTDGTDSFTLQAAIAQSATAFNITYDDLTTELSFPALPANAVGYTAGETNTGCAQIGYVQGANVATAASGLSLEASLNAGTNIGPLISVSAGVTATGAAGAFTQCATFSLIAPPWTRLKVTNGSTLQTDTLVAIRRQKRAHQWSLQTSIFSPSLLSGSGVYAPTQLIDGVIDIGTTGRIGSLQIYAQADQTSAAFGVEPQTSNSLSGPWYRCSGFSALSVTANYVYTTGGSLANLLRYVRLKWTNGATPQGFFRLISYRILEG